MLSWLNLLVLYTDLLLDLATAKDQLVIFLLQHFLANSPDKYRFVLVCTVKHIRNWDTLVPRGPLLIG